MREENEGTFLGSFFGAFAARLQSAVMALLGRRWLWRRKGNVNLASCTETYRQMREGLSYVHVGFLEGLPTTNHTAGFVPKDILYIAYFNFVPSYFVPVKQFDFSKNFPLSSETPDT